MMRESELLSQIRAVFDQDVTKPEIIVGNGDDGAVISTHGKLIVATDVAVEGVHFRREWSSGFEVGRKITAANLADICAMGGWPEFLLVTAVIPDRWAGEALALAEGIAHEANLVGATVVGGDLSHGKELSISITAMGHCDKTLQRSGAKIGDSVVVSKIPGWSAAGLELLKAGKKIVTELQNRAISEHRTPTLEYEKYHSAISPLSCAIDVSDGLVIDSSRIAQASDVTIELDSKFLVDEDLAKLAESMSSNAMEWTLNGGEDHVLLGTTSHPELCRGFYVIGRVGERTKSLVTLDGAAISLQGYEHQWRPERADVSERPFQP